MLGSVMYLEKTSKSPPQLRISEGPVYTVWPSLDSVAHLAKGRKNHVPNLSFYNKTSSNQSFPHPAGKTHNDITLFSLCTIRYSHFSPIRTNFLKQKNYLLGFKVNRSLSAKYEQVSFQHKRSWTRANFIECTHMSKWALALKSLDKNENALILKVPRSNSRIITFGYFTHHGIPHVHVISSKSINQKDLKAAMYNTKVKGKKTLMCHYNPTYQNSHTHFTTEGITSLKTQPSVFALCMPLYKILYHQE